MPITAHVLVRNDENFVAYAIRSVIDHMDKVLVYDTGSTDKTPAMVERLRAEFPDKVLFEQKGEADARRHTALRQEMLDRTETSWFMIVDGDEVWTQRAIAEAVAATSRVPEPEFVLAPFYTCVGDVYHDYRRQGGPRLFGQQRRLTPRLARVVPGLHWKGDYDRDVLADARGRRAFGPHNSVILANSFWHLTHLERSHSDRDVYSSGGSRADKRRPTYSGIGRRIREPLPEVFDPSFLAGQRMGSITSFGNLVRFVCGRLLQAARRRL